MISITLPLPAKELRPNSRPHWTQRHRAVKSARKIAQVRTLAEGLRENNWTHYRITYHWPTPTRRWDDDNCIAACKAYLDGICTALGIDDRTLRLAGLVHDRSNPGQAAVTIDLWSDGDGNVYSSRTIPTKSSPRAGLPPTFSNS